MAFFPRLLPVTPEQGSKVILSGGGIGLPWDEIDENSSVSILHLGIGDQTKRSSH
ncbi:DUF2442 domain-containing protein [Leptospira stimsonii]|uniref:DUF2442 domain-containing protein n=1 Tax=Leptospira stimsonii TaxID=2202203 RepID=UPI001F4E6CA4|nr:DUF2442 domain-containing protein [Leptospira stimsonii]